MTFKTPADIQRYLLEEDGRKVQSTVNSTWAVGYKEGMLWDFSNDCPAHLTFSKPNSWQPYQEPRPWYETKDLSEPGTVLCWFWLHDCNGTRVIDTLEYYENGEFFMSNHDWGTPDCRPLTPAEIEPFLEAAKRMEEQNNGKV